MKWLTRVVVVLVLLGGFATTGIFDVLIFSPSDSATLNAALLQCGKVSAMAPLLGLILGCVRAIILLFKK